MEINIKKYLEDRLKGVLDVISLKLLERVSKEKEEILRYGLKKEYVARKEINNLGDKSDLEEKIVREVLKGVYLKKGEISEEDNKILKLGIVKRYITQEEINNLKDDPYEDLLYRSVEEVNLPFSLYLS